jgi:hypothetical protein
MGKQEAFLESAIRSASHRINEVVLSPDFASDYQTHGLEAAQADTDRPFGVVYLEAVDLFHFVHAVDASLKGNRAQAIDQASVAFAFLKLTAEIYFSDLKYLASRAESAYTVGGSLMLLGLSRVMLQGDEEFTTAWSKALCSAIDAHGELIAEQVPDEGLAAHIELAAKCWVEGRWANASEINQSLGPYSSLWAATSDFDFHLAIQNLLEHHFREVAKDELTPLAGLCYLAWPSEVLALIPLYRRFRSPQFDVGHDTLPMAWQSPERVAKSETEATSIIRRRAQDFYGTSWVSLGSSGA